jgi:hypothetical protein
MPSLIHTIVYDIIVDEYIDVNRLNSFKYYNKQLPIIEGRLGIILEKMNNYKIPHNISEIIHSILNELRDNPDYIHYYLEESPNTDNKDKDFIDDADDT